MLRAKTGRGKVNCRSRAQHLHLLVSKGGELSLFNFCKNTEIEATSDLLLSRCKHNTLVDPGESGSIGRFHRCMYNQQYYCWKQHTQIREQQLARKVSFIKIIYKYRNVRLNCSLYKNLKKPSIVGVPCDPALELDHSALLVSFHPVTNKDLSHLVIIENKDEE